MVYSFFLSIAMLFLCYMAISICSSRPLFLLAAEFALVALPFFEFGVLGWSLLPDRLMAFVIGVTLQVLGLGFAVWARVNLGEYWSGTIDIKVEHRLIRSGPYALVRHPIYSGLVLAFLGTALAGDEVRGLLALALFISAYARKMWIEEQWLVRHFGEEYAGYQHAVKALLPFLW